jgi:putative nucleotide binding protein
LKNQTIIGGRVLEKRYEEYAYVLDYLLRGRPGSRPHRGGTLIQVVGEYFFTLLEVVVRRGINLKLHDRVYVGKAGRYEVTYIIGRIGYGDLTTASKMELETVVEKIVLKREKFFLNFFNSARAITPRMHSLELIPGIGKKYMWQIIDEREKIPFISFKDLQKRTNVPNPSKIITKRILEELSLESKHRLFTRPE